MANLKDVVGFPGYLVGLDGSVWSCWTKQGVQLDVWHELIGSPNKGGYLCVGLWRERRQHTIPIHRLVLEAFVGPRPSGMQCRHYPDTSKTNNRLSNISWAEQSINENDKVSSGTSNKGIGHGNSKLNDKDIASIWDEYKSGRYTRKQIAANHGVSTHHIDRIIRGEHWSSSIINPSEVENV